MGFIKINESLATFFEIVGFGIIFLVALLSTYIDGKSFLIVCAILLIIVESVYWSIDVKKNSKLNRWQKTFIHKVRSLGSISVILVLPLVPIAVWFWLNSLKFKKD